MNQKRNFLLLLLALFSIHVFAQRGIHGAKTVTTTNDRVNEYTALTADILAGATTITVASSTLNANGRFALPLQPGDLIMIYEVQGVFIHNQFDVGVSDTAWGHVTDYFQCGVYEFAQVKSSTATTITVDCPLVNAFNTTNGQKAEVIRVPRYTSLTVNSGDTLTCDDWNGTIGGVLAVEVNGNVTINANGYINTYAKGFRGGSLVGDNVTTFGANRTYSTSNAEGAEKGEGIVGYQAEYDLWGGRYCRGAGANGGGGGDAHNSGGGGGGNAPNSTGAAVYRGWGVPDLTGLNYNIAWGLDNAIIPTLTTANSSGGGKGGYDFSTSNQNAITTPPGNAAWGGDNRSKVTNGCGGRPLNYASGRLFLGGGGGAGDQNNLFGGNGGDGGGMIYLLVYGSVNGTGNIVSNGQSGFPTGGVPPLSGYSGTDGAGGGGAGGTIVVRTTGTVANTITITTNGGKGGNQVLTAGALFVGTMDEAEGPGGGGSGGYITVTAGAPTRTSSGGNNGTTNSNSLTEFIPNGATKGCPGTNNATITAWDITVAPVTICTGNAATLTAVITGTGPVGTFQWYTTATGGVAIGSGSPWTTPVLGATTTYYVGLCNGGWFRVPVVVTVVGTPTVTLSASTNPICSGSSTTLTAGGATTYNWMPGSLSGTSVVVSPASTTTYTVTGTAVGGCFSTAQITVTVNPTPTVTASAASPTICSGNSTNLTGSGATSYTWNPGALSGTTVSVTPASTTTYTVTGTSAGCSSTAQVTVTVNPSPTVTSTAASPTICSGNSTTLTGGGASTYSWMPGSLSGTTVTVTPATTTTYTVTGTAANGCTSTSQVTVTVNPTPTVTATASSPTICSGNSTNLTGSGATTYTWNPGALSGTTVSVSPATTTTYTVTGTSTGCSSTAQVTVTVNATPTVTSTAASPTICSGNSTTLTGGGASTYSWMPGSLSGTTVTVTPATTTTYTVTGTAANGCTSTSQVTVTVNATPTVTSTAASPTICSGNSTTLTGGGASTYSWMPGSLSGTTVTVTPATTTTYTVTGTAANGCTSTSQVTVNVNTTPTISVVPAAISICNGASTTLTASGGTSYTWNPGSLSGSSVTVSPSSTTTYTVTGTTGSCSSTAQSVVTVNPLPTPSAVASPATICIGQTVTLTGGGGANYVWNGGSLVGANGAVQTDAPAVTTTYTVDVTDANGCFASTQTTVTVNALPLVNAGVDQTICSGTSISVTATGGVSYVWNGGSFVNASGATQTEVPTATTNYTVVVTDANACNNSDTVTVNVNALPAVTVGPDVSVCINSSIQLNASGATTYVWSPGTNLDFSNISNPICTPTAAITYTVVGTDANGCVNSDTITVSIGTNLTIFAGADVTICSGDTAQLSTSGGTTYVWSPSSSLLTPNSATTGANPSSTTTYIVNVTDANACTGSDTITVFVNPAAALTVTGTTPICAGQTSTITTTTTSGTGPFTYSWSNGLTGAGPQTVTPGTTTTYTVSVTDANGCSSPIQSVLVTVNPTQSVALQSSANVNCFNGTDGTATVLPSGGNGPYTYAWSPSGGSAATANGLSAGSYTVTVTSADGCTATQSVTLTQPTAITLISASSPENCTSQDGTASVAASGGTPGFTYLWSNAMTGDTIIGIASGSYAVTATDANGCTTSTTVVVGNSSSVTADAGTTVTITQGQSTTLNGSGGTIYSWSPGTDLSCTICQNPIATPTVTTTYTLTVSDGSGCFQTDTVTVIVDIACGEVFLPKAFSPNGDNVNDTFYVRGNCFQFLDFQIFNRWGEKVFSTNDPSVGWDGKWRGEPCESATFTYYLRATMLDGTQRNLQGTITLVK